MSAIVQRGTDLFLDRLIIGTPVVFALALAWVNITTSATTAANNERKIALYSIHTKETLDIVYRRNGKRLPAAMKQINWIMRDWRQNEATTMDPKLVDLLWEIHNELGSHEPIHIISGYRSRKTNNMLRKTRGGQAKKSRHILGKAVDVHFPDIPVKQLRYSALIRERGGVGYYPTSAIPFVHVDTGRVRHWPRMPRHELALLFPSGRSKHVPRGGRLTRKDVLQARKKHKGLAVQIAAFHDFRRQPKAPRPTIIARAAPPRPAVRPRLPAPSPGTWTTRTDERVAALRPGPRPPQLLNQPRLAERPSTFDAPTARDRARLTDLVALAALVPPVPNLPPASGAQNLTGNRLPPPTSTPQAGHPGQDWAATVHRPEQGHGRRIPPLQNSTAEAVAAANRPPASANTLGRFDWGSGWIAAPAYDDEHPEELYYRPFALAPLLTSSPSPDDPQLAKLEHPDVEGTLDFISDDLDALPLEFGPNETLAAQRWAQQFSGKAVAALSPARKAPHAHAHGLTNRKVQTSARK